MSDAFDRLGLIAEFAAALSLSAATAAAAPPVPLGSEVSVAEIANSPDPAYDENGRFTVTLKIAGAASSHLLRHRMPPSTIERHRHR